MSAPSRPASFGRTIIYASHSVLVSGLVRFKLKEIVSGKVVDPLLKPGDRFCFAVNAL